MNQFFKTISGTSRKIKMIISGKAGTGKTWYALTAPKPLAILDLEGGSAMYHSRAEIFGGFDRLQTRSLHEIEESVKSLETDTHYQSLVIDPITIYYELLQESYQEKRIQKSKNEDAALVMKDWGDIKKRYKSLITRLINLDKNIIIICREKDVTQEINGSQVVVGFREDCEKSTEYMPDISLRLSLSGTQRKCLVKKDRTITYQAGEVIDLPDFLVWLKTDESGKKEIIEPDDTAASRNAKDVSPPEEVSSVSEKESDTLPEEWSKWILRINSFRSSSEASAWWTKHKEEIKSKVEEKFQKELYEMIIQKSSELKNNKKEVANV